MKKLISIKLALVLLLSSLTSLGPISIAFAQSSNCENGECIPKIVNQLKDLGKVYQKECSQSLENGLTERCWKIITEINHLETELQKHQTRLEARLGCESGDCKQPKGTESLNSQIAALSKVEQNVSCTPAKKQQIKNSCSSDMTCVLAATALGAGGYLAELIVPEKSKPKNCHLGDDSCLTQLATGFLKAAISFFEGAWDLMKIMGKAAGKKMTEFWNWVKGAEDHSSTSQLAMAKASEDKGVFDMLMNDFPGTMKKIWTGFVGTMKEWLKTDIFCQKWSGTPHFSTCQKPTESFDCIPCKTMVTGLCSVTGTLVAEVVPSFLTGGLITAAKHGANGAVKISKMLKISDKGARAIKGSRVAKVATEASTKVDDVLKLTKGVKAAKTAVDTALKSIKAYLLSPARKALKESYASLSSAIKKGTAYVAVTPAGKTIVFSGKALKLTGKVVIYPIENPLTVFAFKAGQRSFDKVLKLGSPKIASATGTTASIISKDKGLETLLGKIEEAKVQKNKAADLAKLEEELLNRIEPHRRDLIASVLKDDKSSLDDVIRHLYPELQYGDLAAKLPQEKILAAEKDLYLAIKSMPDGPKKTALTKSYDRHVIQGEARAKVVKDNAPTYKQILDNAELESKARFDEAMKLLKREPTSEEADKLAKALEEAHLVAPENGVFEYSWVELREKYRILIEGGYTPSEADALIRAGLAGRPPVRELIEPGQTLFSGFAEDIVDAKYLDKRKELFELIEKSDPAEKKSVFGKIADMFKAPKPVPNKIQDNFEALYFIDYQHTIPELENFMQGRILVKDSGLSSKYEEIAFENFKSSRNYLLDKRPEVNTKTLLEIHKKMMKGGVEKVTPDQLGIIRDGEWYGNVSMNSPIDASVLKEVKNNPYLTWVEDFSWGDGQYAGKIIYPNINHVKKEGLDLIRKNHEGLVLQIEEYQNYSKIREAKFKNKAPQKEIDDLDTRYEQMSREKAKITQKLVDAMVDDLMDWFTRERTLIGDISSPEKLDEFVNLVAKFQRDLVSIHPLANGNGRSTREMMSYLLMREGFPPPRILDTSADIYRSQEDWQKIIKHGILASDFLIDDMIERVKFGLPIENSLEIVTPYTRPPVKMTLKGEKKTPQMQGVEYIDPRLYREIVKREVTANPMLAEELRTDPIKAWDKLHAKAGEVFAKNNIYYKHPKKGIERVSLSFVDDDFKLLYGKASFDNKELFDFKMKTWYSEDITWRGLSSQNKVHSEADIIEMFTELTTHNASNAVLRKVGSKATPETIRKAAIEDFEKYNDNVFGEGLVAMARDHSETGPMYGISYGYSTSKNREVGKAFAMGAMVVGEYGAHKAPELQALLKSRVLVGARRAHKDVDLGRLKQVREEFSYKYGRQQEVMGIGASDPDAITIAQTINAEGGVDLTYLRNKNNPKEIYVVKGDIDPNDTPTPDKIVKTITLK